MKNTTLPCRPAWLILQTHPEMTMFDAVNSAYADLRTESPALGDANRKLVEAILDSKAVSEKSRTPIHDYQDTHSNEDCIKLMKEACV